MSTPGGVFPKCGHPRTEANARRTRQGRWVCRTCDRDRRRVEYRQEAAQRSGLDLSDPAVAAVLAAMDAVVWTGLMREDVAVLAVGALREAGLLAERRAAS